MKRYYIYTKTAEMASYAKTALEAYHLEPVAKDDALFDIDAPDAIVLLHLDAFADGPGAFVAGLTEALPGLRILALTNRVSFSEGTSLLRLGVKGYGNSYMHHVQMRQAVEVIMSGNVWIYPELALHLIKNLPASKEEEDTALESLSPQEHECALLAAKGNANKEIAALLNLQEITIKKHLSAAYRKLGIKNRFELALYMRRDSL